MNVLASMTIAYVVFYMVLIQEAQVTLDCAIPRKHHGSIMGPKGHRIQEISKTYNVAIKIPDRNTEGKQSVVQNLCSSTSGIEM